MDKSDLQEQLAALYLRLNGYFVSGFIIHAPEGEVNDKDQPRSARGDIDVLAVRFPHNAEPERETEPSPYLRVSGTHIDILICEVKGGNQPLQFNHRLRTCQDAARSVMRWIGILDEDNTKNILEEVERILSTEYPNSPDTFREYNVPGTNYRIRAIFFALDRAAPAQPNQQRYIYGEEILSYIWRCLRPTATRLLSQTRYDFGLWGSYEEIIRYFKYKEGNGPGTMQDLYVHFNLAE
jgi:hypothetical protein